MELNDFVGFAMQISPNFLFYKYLAQFFTVCGNVYFRFFPTHVDGERAEVFALLNVFGIFSPVFAPPDSLRAFEDLMPSIIAGTDFIFPQKETFYHFTGNF